jgi:hypothetical protein
MTHDATTGFNDIKALPEFAPPSYFQIVLSIAFGVILLLIVVKAYSKLRRQMKKTEEKTSSKEVAISHIGSLLEQLKAEKISIREYSSEVSLAFRGFLEEQLGLPATDLTSKEIASSLLPALLENSPEAETEQLKMLKTRTTKILQSFEGITFKRHNEAISSATAATKQAEEIIIELSQEKSA